MLLLFLDLLPKPKLWAPSMAVDLFVVVRRGCAPTRWESIHGLRDIQNCFSPRLLNQNRVLNKLATLPLQIADPMAGVLLLESVLAVSRKLFALIVVEVGAETKNCSKAYSEMTSLR